MYSQYLHGWDRGGEPLGRLTQGVFDHEAKENPQTLVAKLVSTLGANLGQDQSRVGMVKIFWPWREIRLDLG